MALLQNPRGLHCDSQKNVNYLTAGNIQSVFKLLSSTHPFFFPKLCWNRDLNEIHTLQLSDMSVESFLIYMFFIPLSYIANSLLVNIFVNS